MANETEKLTINLGIVELAQIDVLVEQGIYSNRSDFIRTAVRKHLETYSERMELPIAAVSSKHNWTEVVGILTITRRTLEKLANNHEMLNISVIGMLIIGNNIDAELFVQTIDVVLLRGKLIAPSEIRDVIEKASLIN